MSPEKGSFQKETGLLVPSFFRNYASFQGSSSYGFSGACAASVAENHHMPHEVVDLDAIFLRLQILLPFD